MIFKKRSVFFMLALGVFSAPQDLRAQMLTGFDTPESLQQERAEKHPEEEQNVAQKTAPKSENTGSPQRPLAPLTAPFFEPIMKNIGRDNAASAAGDAERTNAAQNVQPLSTQNLKADESSENAPVDLMADNLQHDDRSNVVTASGNVMLVQAGRILRADEIRYFVDEDRVEASGNVVLNEKTGDIYFADSVEFTEELKNGFVEGLKAYLADGSRFQAKEGARNNGNETVMRSASYTPCDPCKENPEAAPVWQIRASEVTHDEEAARISYRNARFELYGVPVFYTPYFAHADGTVKRKSGFVSPTLGFDSQLGASAGIDYYWAIAPDKDATIGLIAFSDENPLVTGQWRQRWDHASLIIDAGTTYSTRIDQSAGQSFRTDDEWRGHVFAKGLWDIDKKWRAGLNVEHVSDDQYLRQYDFSSEDVLESQLYAERFSGRDYAVARLLKFQDVRIREEQEDQPEVLPEMIASFIGDPGGVSVIGGRWDLETSFLGLRRDGKGRDMNRFSVDGGWERRLISDLGLVLDLDGSVRADAYNIRDRSTQEVLAGREEDSSENRLFARWNMQGAYPLVKNMERAQIVIEPTAAITLSPNIDLNEEIPNEDSQDVQIDVSNLFEPDRFPGLDRIEDGSHATYGLRTGIYGFDGSFLDVFAGQSRRFNDEDNPFPEGSGLYNQSSDYVGEISAQYQGKYALNYRTQIDSENMSSQRHELYSNLNFGRFSLQTQYLYANALGNTDLDESREQIANDIGYYFSTNWRGRIGATQDLGQDPGLRQAYAGLDYFGQCISWSFEAQRNLTDDASGDSDTEFLFRLGLKNLGEFQTSDYTGAKRGVIKE